MSYLRADEAFFTGTAVEITPISKIDSKLSIGMGSRGPITEKLQKTYNDIIFGKNKNYESLVKLSIILEINCRNLKIAILSYRSAPFGGGQGVYVHDISKALLNQGS